MKVIVNVDLSFDIVEKIEIKIDFDKVVIKEIRLKNLFKFVINNV